MCDYMCEEVRRDGGRDGEVFFMRHFSPLQAIISTMFYLLEVRKTCTVYLLVPTAFSDVDVHVFIRLRMRRMYWYV